MFSPLRIEVPLGHPLHELLGRQREEHAVGGDGYHRRHVHDLLPVADVAHSSAVRTHCARKTGVMPFSCLGVQPWHHSLFTAWIAEPSFKSQQNWRQVQEESNRTKNG